MEPGSLPTFGSDYIGDSVNLMGLSISELISILRTAFRTSDFDRVEEVLVAKEARLKGQVEEKRKEIGSLHEKLEVAKLDRMKCEEELRKCREECEKGKKAEERYEKLLKAVKSGLGDQSTVAELNIKQRELEDEKRRVESQVENWKGKFKELGGRILILENDVKFLMNNNGNTHFGRNTEGDSGVIRRNIEVESRAVPGTIETDSRNADDNLSFNADTRQSPININKGALGESGSLGLESIIEIEDSDNDESIVKGGLQQKEATPIVADRGLPSSSIQQKNSPTRMEDLYENLKRRLKSRYFSHGLGTKRLEGSDTDDSSSSSSGSDFNMDLVPLKSYFGRTDKRRKTEADSF